MQFHHALNPRRIARSLVTVLVLTLIETIVAPVVAPLLTAPPAKAVTATITPTSNASGTYLTIPSGVSSVTIEALGGGGGKGGNDGNTGGSGTNAGYVVTNIPVSPGDVLGLYPGKIGTAGTDSAQGNGGGAGAADTLPDYPFSLAGTYSALFNFGGGSGGAAGSAGSSGGGGGAGSASIATINSEIVVVAGGAGGGGGAGNGTSYAVAWSGTYAFNGTSFTGSNGAGLAAANSCPGATNQNGDGGGGGGGGGGYYGGAGGAAPLRTSECSGTAGSAGGNYVVSRATSTPSNTLAAQTTEGYVKYTYNYDAIPTCAKTTTANDIYTIEKITYTGNCNWIVPSTVSVVDLFLVGGGGGGSNDGGTGGGGGAALLRTAIAVTSNSTLNLKVGYGGAGSGFGYAWSPIAGESTTVVINGVVYSANGGSAGGGGPSGTGGAGGTAGNAGFAGGAGGTSSGASTRGAAGGAGKTGTSNYFLSNSGNTYGGGGGGGAFTSPSCTTFTAAAGSNGGGAGAYMNNSVSYPGSDGVVGTGGGGGGGMAVDTCGIRLQGGKGGSGVILIRYATNSANAFPVSLTSALAGRWTADGVQTLDSTRKNWIDSSGTYGNVAITGSPIVTTQGALDGSNSTGSSKTNLIVAGGTGASATFVSGALSNYTLMHVARYPRTAIGGGAMTSGRIVTASSGNFISGHYNTGNESLAWHSNGWMNPTGSTSQYKWLLSTDMTKMYRANGRDLTYKADVASVSGAAGPTGLGVNNYSFETTDWQITDVMVFNRQLTNGEMRAMEIYMSRIYGLTLDISFATSDTDTAATMGSSSSNYYFFNGIGAGNTLNDTFTIEAWVKPTSTCESNICQIVVKESTVLFGIHSGYLYWALNGSNIGWNWTSTGIRIKPGEWSHVTMVKQYSGDKNGSLLFYLNGRLAFTQAASPYASSTNYNSTSSTYKVVDADDNWYLFGGRANQYFYGDIDEIKIWKVARSESEVRTDMYSNDGSSTNLQMYYNFNMDASTYPDISDGSVTPIVTNLAAGGVARSDLYTYYGSTYPTIENRVADGPYTKITIPRTIITKNGGWVAPVGVSQIQTVVIGGGGGGGGGYEGGGGGAGGFIETITSITAGSIYPIVVGVGGRGTSYPSLPTNGDTTTAFNLTALGGGSGTVEFNDGGNNRQYTNTSGGSGGGGSWSTYMSGAAGTSGQGNAGGSSSNLDVNACGAGNIVFAGAGGGGAGGVGQDATCLKGGNGGAGRASTVLGSTVAAGGGGSLRPFSRTITSAVQGLGGTGGGGNSAYTDGAAIDASGGATNGTANTGSGGGAGYAMNGYSGVGGNGGLGIVGIRYITALKPAYSKPTTAYLNAGMTETFTTNVAADSATAVLTRTFKWESTTAGETGTYLLLKSGTGALNAAYSWIPSDTSTSGSQYLYRLTVTDSDTAGLFITDSSTAYAVINPALKVTSSAASNTLAKRINVTRNETFTITLGTPTYKATLSPVIPGITIDTSTAGSVVLRIGDTATVGTWLETLTVTDSVSASVNIALTINIAAPPTLLNTGEIVSNGLVLNLDAGNSRSLIYSDTTTVTNAIWRDLSGNGKDAQTSGTFDARTCTAPVYSPYNGGYLNLNGSTDCFWSPYVGYQMEKSFTVETWFKLNGSAFNTGASIITQNYSSKNINFVLGDMLGNSTITVAFYEGTWRYCNTGFTPTNGVWNHIVGTYDGNNMILYVNGVQFCSVAFSGGLSTSVSYDGTFIGRRHDGGSIYYANGSIATARIYRVPLTATQVAQNYNATKARFDRSNLNLVIPNQKYGAKTLESFTATSGIDTDTVTFATGNRNGVLWDTTTVANQINLTLQESLTPGTFLETVTITDSLAQSTYLPIRMTVAKADTLTVYVDTPTALNYTGSQAKFTSTIKSIGAVGLESGTVFSAPVSFKPGGTSCATGGYCRVGDIGPAGGVIFIDTSTASSDGRIYEAAPQNWTGSDDLASVAAFCIGTAASANITNGSQVGIGWGDTLTANFDAGCTGGAVQVAADLVLNGYSDWFVPSENEGVQLIAARNQAGLLQIGNTWTTGNWGYWTSTESSASVLRIMGNIPVWGIGNGDKGQALKFMLRPVRAFKPCWAIDTCTSLSTTDTPTSAGLYNMVPTTLSNAADLLTKYTNVVYSTTNLTINRVAPSSVTIPWINTNYPDTFTINFTSTAGNQTIRYSTTNGTASGCALDYKKIYTTSQGTCFVTITRAGDRNFLPDTITATIFFLAWVNSQPTNQVGSGNTIAINGVTSYSVDTTTPPSITTLSTTLISLGSGGTFTINGTGFGASGLTVKFWRNKVVTPTGSTATTITFNVSDIGSSGATTGRIAVTTVNGQDFSTDTLTITP